MIIDISDNEFKNIFNNQKLFLPIRWNGNDFEMTLRSLFNFYIKQIEREIYRNRTKNSYFEAHLKTIKRVCGLIATSVNQYSNGFPSDSYKTFGKVMDILSKQRLEVFKQQIAGRRNGKQTLYGIDDLDLFRVVGVEDNKPYGRERVFHTPYNLRSKVSTCRYSIAGYPSLYLGTSLNLCCEEMQVSSNQKFTLASVFKLENTLEYSNTNISIIELGIKPQDFVYSERENNKYPDHISPRLFPDKTIKSAYLLWYPLIAACSYIRVNKSDPFAAEYIIPQLLMQWVRHSMRFDIEEDFEVDNNYDQLVGIRYFSCASEKASNMGLNYVFPTSGNQISCELPYCAVLAKTFRLTEPRYIHEYDDIDACEYEIQRLMDLDFIN